MYLARFILALALFAFFTGCAHDRPASPRHIHLTDHNIAVLNALRDAINSVYGFREVTPRINLGPCGRFAKAFREEWNARSIVREKLDGELEILRGARKLPFK